MATHRANNYGVASTMPPDNPSRRVDMLNLDEIAAKVAAGQNVSLCRCYASKSFPYCDGSHNKHNAETGDNVAPLVITKGLPADKRGLTFSAQISEDEKNKEAKGPRANNYGVASNMPPDNPTKCVHMLDVEDIQKATSGGGACSVCRCFKSKTFPLCDGSHNSHNTETGDNAGPAVLKPMGPPKDTTKRANHYGVPSTLPPEKPNKRVDMLDVQAIIDKVEAGQNVALCRCYASKNFPYCDGSHVKHNAETGDNAAPVVITKGLASEQRGLTFSTQISEEEKSKDVKGPRANNYGVASNAPPPPAAATKCVHMLDVEDIKAATANGAPCSLCRCYKSKKFPLCDGSHNSHNEETGDNAGPAVLKAMGDSAPAPPPSTRALDKDLPVITLEQVQKHNSESDAWTIIHGKVYDISDFIDLHPGGKAVLQQYAGKVADEGFDGVHHESIIMENLGADKLIGQVSVEDAKREVTSTFEPPPIESVLNLYDLEQIAHASMRDTAWGYWFTGATDEFTKWGNQEIYRRIRLVPRVMRDVSTISMETTMLGHKMAFPVYISAAAKGGLGHPEAEEALCRAAHAMKVIQMVPHMGTRTLDVVAKCRAPDQVQFLQLYAETDRAATEATVKLANECGYSALFITVDSAGIGKRETDLRLTPGGSAPRSAATKRRWAADLTWADVPWFRKLTDMPLVLKGVQSGADAVMAYEHGLNGIVVSNHGGRNQDTARPSLEALVEIMASLRAIKYDPRKFEVYIDGGVRRGTDVFKALALGAKAVGIGRASLYGLAAYGQPGVEKCLEILQDELFTTMQMMGAPTLDDFSPDMLKGVEHIESWSWSTSRDHATQLKL